MKTRLVLACIVLVFLSGTLFVSARPLEAKARTPRFLAMAMPGETGRETPVGRSVEHAVRQAFIQKGFLRMGDKVREAVVAGSARKHGEAVRLARQYGADLLVEYAVKVRWEQAGKGRYHGGFVVDVTVRAVDPASGRTMGHKSGSAFARVPESALSPYKNPRAVKAAGRLAEKVARALAGLP